MSIELEAAGLAYVPTGALFGYRTWALQGYLLRSSGFVVPVTWPPDKPLRALCPRAFLWRGHPAPGPKCSCGIHAWRSPSSLQFQHPMIASLGLIRGVVQLWGTVVVHQKGYRAEYGRIVAVYAGLYAEAISETYRVPILPELDEYSPPRFPQEPD